MNTNGAPSRSFAAIFLDFENVYYFLKNEFADPPELNAHVLEMLRNLRTHLEDNLEDNRSLDSIIINAYADFERIGSSAQGPLYLQGVDTKNVLGTEHKNAADMRLCIDVLEVLYTRREIDTFVLVAGDRDYIPVIQHLRRHAKRVLGVGFRESVSGDLLQNLGDKQFIDARDLLDASTLERLEDRRRDFHQRQAEREARFDAAARARDEKAMLAMRAQGTQLPPVAFDVASPTPLALPPDVLLSVDGLAPMPLLPLLGPGEGALSSGDAQHEESPDEGSNGDAPHPAIPGGLLGAIPGGPSAEAMKAGAMMSDAHFDPVQHIEDDDARFCLGLILNKLRQLQKTRYTNEIWLGPFLRHLTDEMPALADFERRMLLDMLSRSGAIRIEKRDGEPYPYSVVLVNYAHPDVWDLNPG